MIGKTPRIEQRAPIGLTGKDLRLRAALGPLRRRIRQLTEEKEAMQREVAELRQVVAKQTEYLDTLAARVELMSGRESDLQAILLGAHEQLMNRVDEIRDDLAAELHRATADRPQRGVPEQNLPYTRPSIAPFDQAFVSSRHNSYQQLSKRVHYQRLIQRIREVVRTTLPPDATVIVANKGDEELLDLGEERRGWHFPQNEEGAYAGYHPADSAEAIAHLEELRTKGAQFLLLPETALWWLEHYEEFARHLDSCYRRLRDDPALVVYELSEPQTGSTKSSAQ